MASNYSLEVKNYNIRTPKTLKLIADIMLMLIPVAETAKISCPDFPGKEWVFWGLITFFSLFKIISKFVAENAEATD
jgi:hypothetical protein